MQGVVLAEDGSLLDLAHHNDNGGNAAKEGIARALVVLPGIDEVGDALLEDLGINLDAFFCHGGRLGERLDGRLVVGVIATMASDCQLTRS